MRVEYFLKSTGRGSQKDVALKRKVWGLLKEHLSRLQSIKHTDQKNVKSQIGNVEHTLKLVLGD